MRETKRKVTDKSNADLPQSSISLGICCNTLNSDYELVCLGLQVAQVLYVQQPEYICSLLHNRIFDFTASQVNILERKRGALKAM